ncbi:MAG: hypothetical protein OXH79_03355 [Boseongicola sp.]|nr:hypothetical protein [Boseongicola sp.]
MFVELIATFVAGLGAAGVVLLINLATRDLLPRWAMPAAAGAGMIGLAVALEMTWASRTIEGLPQGVAVADTVSESAWYRPWTYLWPQTTRIMAIDTDTVRKNEAAPDTRLIEVYLLARWQPTQRVPQLIDCATGARADVTDITLADPAAANWRPVTAAGDIVRLACGE